MSSKYLAITSDLHQAPAVGPLRFELQTDGEMVKSGFPEVGFLHRGIEKIAERMAWRGFLPYTDRVDYLAAIHCNLAYTQAVESLSAIEVPERAQHVRVIASELNRIASHLINIGKTATVVGLSTGQFYVLREREKINNLFELLCGARLTYSYIRVGGVALDITEGFIEKAYEFVESFLPKIKEINDLLSNNIVFAERLKGIGFISRRQAIRQGLTGPNARAAGLQLDQRKSFPYSGYHKFDFTVPVAGQGDEGGDSFDRYMIRIREMEQSCAIIKQALDSVPDGVFCADIPRIFKAPKGEAYSTVESPRGTFGVYISSNGEKTPERVHFRAPSLAVLNLFPGLLQDVPLSDFSVMVCSLDIMVSEIDR